MSTFRPLLSAAALLLATVAARAMEVRTLKITLLSTMLADKSELGEWGFSALVEADGHRILFDTGLHPDLVLQNVRSLKIDLTTVPVVILSHNHQDHTGGLLALRRSVLPAHPEALATAHVATGIFYPRPMMRESTASGPARPPIPVPNVDENTMRLTGPAYEHTGGKFVTHDRPMELYPGVWLTGPIPRVHPERNWSGDSWVATPAGVVEDNIPEDMSLIIQTPRGNVVLTGCGHAGIVNICEYSRRFLPPARLYALIGGIHLFAASDDTIKWTVDQLKPMGVDNFLAAHCTGIETLYTMRRLLGLDRAHAVVGAVGASFQLDHGIDPGVIAQ